MSITRCSNPKLSLSMANCWLLKPFLKLSDAKLKQLKLVRVISLNSRKNLYRLSSQEENSLCKLTKQCLRLTNRKEMPAKSSTKCVRKASWTLKKTKSWTINLYSHMTSSKLWQKIFCQLIRRLPSFRLNCMLKRTGNQKSESWKTSSPNWTSRKMKSRKAMSNVQTICLKLKRKVKKCRVSVSSWFSTRALRMTR